MIDVNGKVTPNPVKGSPTLVRMMNNARSQGTIWSRKADTTVTGIALDTLG